MSDSCVIQVTNIAPSVTNEQMKSLFGFLGTIKEIFVYPNEDTPIPPTSRVCYIRYAESSSAGVAQHMTNTVFVDRALIVMPVDDGKIPDASTAMNLTSGGPLAGGSNSGVVSQVITGVGGAQVITTIDPRLTALGLPQYPPLPANMDPTKIEEIRRTVYVGNLDSTLSAEQLLTFFNQIGEVKYIRMAGDETQPTRFAFVEFTDQSSVANALQYNGVILGGRPLKINHSNNSIVKPQAKSSEAAQKEIEEAMKRVREAQTLISAAIEPGLTGLKFDKILELATKEDKKSRSRSRSRSRRRSRSRSRRRSRSRNRRSRERSRERRRSRSRERKRSRSPRRRSRSHEKRRTRSRSRDRRHRDRERRRSRSRDRDRDREREREERHSRRRSRSRERDKERDKSYKRKHSRSRSRSKKRDEKEKMKESEKIVEKPKIVESVSEPKPEGPELPPPVEVKSEILKSPEPEVQEIPDHSRDISPKSLSASPQPSTKRSRTPKKRSRSRERRHSRTPTKSHKKKREKDRDRERERDRDRERSRSRDRKDKKKRRRDREESTERSAKESRVRRDYDEEEKGYDSDDASHRLGYDNSRKASESPFD